MLTLKYFMSNCKQNRVKYRFDEVLVGLMALTVTHNMHIFYPPPPHCLDGMCMCDTI